MEEEDDLVQDNLRTTEEISRQLEIINRNTERRNLEREKEEAEDLVRDQLSNSGASDLGIGKTQWLVPQKDSCRAE